MIWQTHQTLAVQTNSSNMAETINIKSSSILIVGAGASGIAAATKLLENGFQNVTILEAEKRIGGRICSVPFGDTIVDIGGQWVFYQIDTRLYCNSSLAYKLGLRSETSL